jgi:pSer/pThr/pTyr-binding forkhead associated (FHA) protein
MDMDNENKNKITDSIKEQEIEVIKEISQEILDKLKSLPKDKIGLMVIKGPIIGESFFIKKDIFKIGRNPDSDILLDDITVSRQHAVIEKAGGDLFIKDMESLNGTYVNGKIIELSKLSNGDRVQIGKYLFLFFSS